MNFLIHEIPASSFMEDEAAFDKFLAEIDREIYQFRMDIIMGFDEIIRANSDRDPGDEQP